MKINMQGLFAIIFCALLILVPIAGCSSGKSTAQSAMNTAAAPAAAPAPDMPPAGEMTRNSSANDLADYGVTEDAITGEYEVSYDEEAGSGGLGGLGGGLTGLPAASETRKIVVTMDLSLQTLEFEAGTKNISAMTEQFGGYIQDSYVEGSSLYDKYASRSAHYTVRVPVESLGEFVDALDDKFNIVHQQTSTSDISNNYFDTKARLESLRVQQERLMEMLEQSSDVKYLLQVQQELANVLYEIERMTSSLNRMDDSVSLSTVTIRLQEVVRYEEIVSAPVSFSERAGRALNESWDAFVSFCQNAVLFLVALVPFLPVIAVIAAVVMLVLRLNKKRAAKKRLQPTQQPPADDNRKDSDV